ncbi:hypothetical protein [Streptococcus pseudopneumoniae]|uniref:hypothetical protein n=2 Tax=Streptococcus TaxID=1301 RepID=UPI00110C38F5|nr:hypothetical protein [Streptococcus pseudopneumoniae]MBF9679309.1 hypothetical protein [Streptococcus pseudopneumoniae]
MGYLIIFFIPLSMKLINHTIIATIKIKPKNVSTEIAVSSATNNLFKAKVIKAVTKIIPTMPTDFTKLSYFLILLSCLSVKSAINNFTA